MMKKSYILASFMIVILVFVIFLLFNMNLGDIVATTLQLTLIVVLSLPALALLIKKPNKMWVYLYPLVLLITEIYNYSSKDALASGLMILFFALPASIIYTFLVMKTIIK